MSERGAPGSVARSSDQNRGTVEGLTSWMAHPRCREAINRRVTGSAHEWPLDWFRRVHAARPFSRGVSWGCGLGAFERSAVRAGLVLEVDAFDVSPASVEDAVREAQAERIGAIRYAVGDFNDPHIEPGRYDVILFHLFLHRVARLGQLFRRLAQALPAGTAVYVEEYVGPSSDDWNDAKLALARKLLDECPAAGKTGKPLGPPVNRYDSSEAIRSGEIRRYLRDYLDVVAWRPCGGQLAGLIFPYLKPDWLQAEEGLAFVRRLMDLEDAELTRNPEVTHHLVAYGTLKDAARLPGLPAQAWRALRRRLHVMRRGQPTHTAAHYWNVNRETAQDPTYWMAHALCREAINRRVTGSAHEWPLDWFRRVHAARPFPRGVSWGCGLGAFERSAVRAGLVLEMDAFDISSASVDDAGREAQAEEITTIRYAVGDFNNPYIEPGRYDVVLFHASLHHVARLGRLFRRLAQALPAGTAVYVEEYVGPSSDDWNDTKLALARKLLDECPAAGKTGKSLEPPVNPFDPSEAIRSGEIRRYLRDYLDVVEWRPYGGQLAGLIFPYLKPDWLQTEEGLAFVRRLMDLEDAELTRDPEATHHLVAYGTLKDAARLPGLRARFWSALRWRRAL